MSDLISRQVLDLWDRYKPTIAVDAIEYDGELKKLLGTNLAEVGTEPTNIVKDCNDKSSVSDDYSYKSAEVGTDCISRQAALDCFHDWIDKHGDVHTPDEMPEYRAIEALPSAQPELSAEDRQLIKKLRSYHNGSYAKVIDRLVASAQQKPLKYSGDSICIYCMTSDCDGCMYEPMEGTANTRGQASV